MSAFKEMRCNTRDDFNAWILYTPTISNNYKHAEMRNFSDGGMYFESDTPMKPGSDLSIRTMNFCSANQGTVRWCKELGDSGSGKYGIGLKCDI